MNFNKIRNFGPTPRYPQVENYPAEVVPKFIAISGSCSVESKEQVYSIAKQVSMAGATHLRGGVFRAGTYPPHNYGLVSEDLLKCYHAAAQLYGLKNIIEVLDYSEHQLDKVSKYCDCFQIGARGMQHYELLRQVAIRKKPTFLKRHPGATIDEFLGAAEYLLKYGVTELYLIERGSSTFENHSRWSLSVSMIAGIKTLTNIPVIVDASHASGRRDIVPALTYAGIAAGADGCLVEVHQDPERSLSDPDQAVSPYGYSKIMEKVKRIKEIV